MKNVLPLDRQSEKASVSITRTVYPHRDFEAAGQIEGLEPIGKPELRHIPCGRKRRTEEEVECEE